MKKVLFLVLAVICLWACEKTPEEIAVTSVSLSQSTAEMIEGETIQLIATVIPSNATDQRLIWASSKTSVATVTDNGLVTAIAEGSSTITVSAGGKSRSCLVTVSKRIIAVTSLSLNKDQLSLPVDSSEKLIATVEPDDATEKTIYWVSSDNTIAEVNQEGLVTGHKSGETTIKAMLANFQAICVVSVYIPVSGISLKPSSLTIPKGSSYTLTAVVAPDDAANKKLSWSSDNTSVATVDNDGRVTAINNGEAIITVKTEDGGYTATCAVTVVIPVTGISINPTSLSMYPGDTGQIVATVAPSDASNKDVTWSSNKPTVVSVNQDGVVSALNGGNAIITARTVDGGYEAKCNITVVVNVQGVSLNTTSLSMMQYDTEQLTAYVIPNDATNKRVIWTSDNTSVATVSSSGLVSAINGGSTIIRVKTEESGYEAVCHVTVTPDAHEAVDLGLSVKWSVCNYGASSPSGTGGFYFWGDPNNSGVFMYYTAPGVDSISGTQYDIVKKNWGGKWRIPTRAEMRELVSKCSLSKSSNNGVSGIKITGPNGNSIFLPYTGYRMPADGPVGSSTVYDTSSGYYMTGDAGSSGMFYICKFKSGADFMSYNASYVKVAIRPVR